MALEKPILVDTDLIAPMADRTLYDSSCVRCIKPRARWVVQSDDGHVSMCSLCWLYDSEWGSGIRDDIDALVADTEFSVGRPFTRDGLGRLAMSADADRILAAICYLSRMKRVADVARKVGDA